MFMERDTLQETCERLPRFASQFGVPLLKLQRLFAEEWLPWISIVSLPDLVRELDARAVHVRDLDADDYPTAALAALLSPCILLTHNYRDFGPLGVTAYRQGVDAVVAKLAMRQGRCRSVRW
jgi:hypothetical protein